MISIITPTLGTRPEYITQAGKSLLNQSYKDIEWIIVMPTGEDNGLFNNLTKILNDNFSAMKCLLIADKEARRVSISRNIGIKASAGDYVGFLDDDDLKYPAWCEKMLNGMNSDSIASICPMDLIDKDGNVKGDHLISMANYETIWNNRALYFANELLIKRDALLEIGMFDENLETSEDYELMIALFKKGKINNIGQKLCAYRQHPDSMSNNSDIRGEPTHRSIHYYHEKYKRNFYCNRCGADIIW